MGLTNTGYSHKSVGTPFQNYQAKTGEASMGLKSFYENSLTLVTELGVIVRLKSVFINLQRRCSNFGGYKIKPWFVWTYRDGSRIEGVIIQLRIVGLRMLA